MILMLSNSEIHDTNVGDRVAAMINTMSCEECYGESILNVIHTMSACGTQSGGQQEAAAERTLTSIGLT